MKNKYFFNLKIWRSLYCLRGEDHNKFSNVQQFVLFSFALWCLGLRRFGVERWVDNAIQRDSRKPLFWLASKSVGLTSHEQLLATAMVIDFLGDVNLFGKLRGGPLDLLSCWVRLQGKTMQKSSHHPSPPLEFDIKFYCFRVVPRYFLYLAKRSQWT